MWLILCCRRGTCSLLLIRNKDKDEVQAKETTIYKTCSKASMSQTPNVTTCLHCVCFMLAHHSSPVVILTWTLLFSSQLSPSEDYIVSRRTEPSTIPEAKTAQNFFVWISIEPLKSILSQSFDRVFWKFPTKTSISCQCYYFYIPNNDFRMKRKLFVCSFKRIHRLF